MIALRTGASLVPRQWWRRPPFLPLPDRRWLAFRMETAYGDPGQTPDPHDVLAYLAWSRAERRMTRRQFHDALVGPR